MAATVIAGGPPTKMLTGRGSPRASAACVVHADAAMDLVVQPDLAILLVRAAGKLHAVHAQVRGLGPRPTRVLGVDLRQRDEGAAVVGPAAQLRQLARRDLVREEPAARDLAGPRAQQGPGQRRIPRGLLPRGRGIHAQLDQAPHAFQRVAEDEARALQGAEEVARHGEAATPHAREVERRSAWRGRRGGGSRPSPGRDRPRPRCARGGPPARDRGRTRASSGSPSPPRISRSRSRRGCCTTRTARAASPAGPCPPQPRRARARGPWTCRTGRRAARRQTPAPRTGASTCGKRIRKVARRPEISSSRADAKRHSAPGGLLWHNAAHPPVGGQSNA